jgi:methyl-accepting chemotaxis protein
MYNTIINMPLRFKFWLVNGFSFIGMSVLSLYAIVNSFELANPGEGMESEAFMPFFFDQAMGYAVWVFILMCLVLAASQVLIAFVHKHVDALKVAMQKSADSGNLAIRVEEDCTDEIGQMSRSFNFMQEKLHSMVAELQSMGTEVNGSAKDFMAAAEGARQASDQQRASSSDVLSSVNSLINSSSQVLDKAEQARTVSEDAEQVLSDGRTSIEAIISATKVIAKDISETSSYVTKLAEDSENINQFLDVIRSISEQTNLLALNAAIEAARAGEQGRGFAVVADEVRSLASKTHEATDKIADILNQFAELTQTVVNAMEASTSHINESVENADFAQTSFSGIADAVTKLARSNLSIEKEVSGQAAFTQDVHDKAQIIEQVASSREETVKGVYSKASSLLSVSENLKVKVDQFSL